MKVIKLIARIIWIITGGWISFLIWAVWGALLVISVVGLPLGMQCFKAASVSFSPFNRDVELRYFSHPIINTLWLIFFGWQLFLVYLAAAAVSLITIIGIPSSIAALKLSKLSFAPFGAEIIK